MTKSELSTASQTKAKWASPSNIVLIKCFDPDNEISTGGGFAINNVVANTATYGLVSALSPSGNPSTINLKSCAPGTLGGVLLSGLAINDAYATSLYETSNGDQGINDVGIML